MKNEYTFKDGKIIVLDDKLGEVKYEYHDEIDKELLTENVIEQIKTSLESAQYALGCQETLKTKKYSKKKRYLRYVLNVLIPTIITGTFAVLYFGTITLAIFLSIIGFEMGTILNIDANKEYKKLQNRINALLVRISELNDRYIIENKKLNQIRVDKKISTEDQIDNKEFKKVNEENLQKLSNLENLWYQVGYNINNYYNYDQKGILRDTLHDEYTHNGELDEVERITKKHGPVLTKKLIPSRNTNNK